MVKLLNLVIWGRQKKSYRKKSNKHQVYCIGKYSNIDWHDVRKVIVRKLFFDIPRYGLCITTAVSARAILMSACSCARLVITSFFYFFFSDCRCSARRDQVPQEAHTEGSLTWHRTDIRDRTQAQKITSPALKLQRQTPLNFHQTRPHGFHAWANTNTTGVLYLKLAELTVSVYFLVRQAWSFPRLHWRKHLAGWAHVPRLCRGKHQPVREYDSDSTWLNIKMWQSRIRTGWGCLDFGQSFWLSINQRTRLIVTLDLGSWTSVDTKRLAVSQNSHLF